MANELRFGVGMRGEDWDGALRDALEAERLGYDFLRFSDQATNAALEGWTLATAVAARTERVRLLHGTLNLPWRYPPFLVKMAAALDTISRGRLDLCIGSGGVLPFLVEDYAAYGLPVAPAGDRYQSVADFLTLARGLWANERFTFEGKFFQVRDAVCLPKPVSGTVPIWVGAGRPRMLRLIGRAADGWMKNQGWPDSLDDYRAMNTVIDDAARAAGRDPAAIRRELNGVAVVAPARAEAERIAATVGGGRPPSLIGTAAEVVAALEPVIAAGADSFALTFPDPQSRLLFATEVIPALRS